MLTLREKLFVLYSTAPKGFSMSRRDIRLKYGVPSNHVWGIVEPLLRRGVLEKNEKGELLAGPLLRQELGADA